MKKVLLYLVLCVALVFAVSCASIATVTPEELPQFEDWIVVETTTVTTEEVVTTETTVSEEVAEEVIEEPVVEEVAEEPVAEEPVAEEPVVEEPVVEEVVEEPVVEEPVVEAEPEFVYEEYAIGDIGPAGGYIFYDCDADNELGNADNLISDECGWRYLEAAPYGVNFPNNLFQFGYCHNGPNGENVFVNNSNRYRFDDCTNFAVGTGKANTELLLNAMGERGYLGNNLDTVYYAAKVATNYKYKGYTDWYLPSLHELHAIYRNLKANGIGSYANGLYWSSSEHTVNAAYVLEFKDTTWVYKSAERNTNCRVLPVRCF